MTLEFELSFTENKGYFIVSNRLLSNYHDPCQAFEQRKRKMIKNLACATKVFRQFSFLRIVVIAQWMGKKVSIGSSLKIET